MMFVCLMVLLGASVGHDAVANHDAFEHERQLPGPDEPMCPIFSYAPPLAAFGDAMQTLDESGHLAVSHDAGRSWHIDTAHCNGVPGQFWSLSASSRKRCLISVPNSNDFLEEHRCTRNRGRTWTTMMVTDVRKEQVTDVTADPRDSRKLLAVRTRHAQRPAAVTLILSEDGGHTWRQASPDTFGSLQIAGVVGDDALLTLRGPRFAAYDELWLREFEHGTQVQVAGPWQYAAGMELTQAGVNPLDGNQWLVSTWHAPSRVETTYITFDRGRSFEELKVPASAVWPLEFVDVRGTLVANMLPSKVARAPARATLLDLERQKWVVFNLPRSSYGHMRVAARGGSVYAADPSTLYRLDPFTGGKATWTRLRVE